MINVVMPHDWAESRTSRPSRNIECGLSHFITAECAYVYRGFQTVRPFLDLFGHSMGLNQHRN